VNPPWSISPAQPSDLDQVAALMCAVEAEFPLDNYWWGVASPDQARPLLELPWFATALARDNFTGQVIGFGGLIDPREDTYPDLELVRMMVHPTAARQGLGRALTTTLLEQADRASRPVQLVALTQTPWVVELYASLGFTTVASSRTNARQRPLAIMRRTPRPTP
jgi:GNAT superfamily N-acetyltransferase